MANIFSDGLQVYPATVNVGTHGDWTLANSTLSSVSGYGGKNCLQHNNAAFSTLTRTFSNTSDTVFVGFRVRIGAAALSNTDPIKVELYETASLMGSVELVNIGPNTAVTLTLKNAAGGTVTTINLGVDSYDTWIYVEVGFEFADTGAYAIKLDETVIASGTADFLSGSNAYCNKAVISFSSYYGHTVYIQDIYLNDDSGAINNTFLGAVYHQLIAPDTDSSVAFTPLSGGDNFAMVDENPHDGDTTYNAANTAVTDEFNFESLTGTPVVFGLNTYLVARDEATGTDPSMHLHAFVKGSSATVLKGTARDVPAQAAYTIYTDSFETDPDTSTLWAYADVNALAAGYLLEAD
jgi:hypothetical protein